MASGDCRLRAFASLISTIGLLLAAASASAATVPGPAYIDELSSQLQPLRDGGPGDGAAAREGGLSVDAGRVLVNVYVDGNPAAAAGELSALGMDVAATATEPRPVVEGYLPLDALPEAAKLDGAYAVTSPSGGGTDVGALLSQSVARHNITTAIASSGANGAGIDVGVISDSINRVAGGVNTSQASGDLPPDPRVVVLDDDTTAGTVDEGRAMAEIVYDEAPGLNRILFSTGTEAGPVAKAASIDSLVANGADVITDDIFRLDEPFFQDGVVAQAVDRARAAGVPYFASAGNRARQSYEGTYRNSGGLHDFDPGAGVDTRSCFSNTMPNGAFMQVALGWDEPVGDVTTDIDIRLTDSAGAFKDVSTADSIANGDPKEIVFFQNAGAAFTPCIEIVRFAGSGTPVLKWIERDDYSQGVPQFDTQSNTINPDAASAQGSLAVAAVSQGDAGLNTPESFSSRGPNTRYLDPAGNRLATPLVLNKPELAATDQVATTVPGFNPFGGTSAASPSAAGIATILRSANPNATVNEIYAQMTDPANAIECTSSAAIPDPDCGAGFILADRAMAALDKTPAVPLATLSPATPNGRQGFYTSDIAVSWTIDPESPTESSTGCEPITVNTDGERSLSCSATSGGGAGTGSVTVKRDAKKPTKPRIKGIKKGKSYSPTELPAKKKVKKCKAKDATSGIESCKVKGYDTKPGKHKLKATATDRAGLKSKASLTYTVK